MNRRIEEEYIPVVPGVKTQFMKDTLGNKIGVFFTLDAYEKLLQKLEDAVLSAKAQSILRKHEREDVVPFEVVKQMVRKKK